MEIRTQKGTITPALLLIASAFIIIIYGLLFILGLQFEYSHRQVASDKALHFAEAGIDYYRWHLNVDPDDFKDGTGSGSGPYEHDYNDPQGGKIGEYSLLIDAPTDSNPVVTITSTGWTTQYPRVKRTIVAKYGRVSLTRFAFLHNSNVWFGDDVTINGPVFSNGGIRLDGHNTSTVESSKVTYTCGEESGCNPDNDGNYPTKPGVWGNGEIDELWSWGVTPIDFDSIKVNFNTMKDAANDPAIGVYLAPTANQGYHLVFSDNGDVTIYEVTGVDIIKGYSLEYGCENLAQEITSQTILGTYSVADKQIIFAEGNVWIEGVVKGKITVVAAKYPLGSYNTTVWITQNITYLDKSGDNKLGLISEKDIVFGRDVPDYFKINGALLAQNGRTIRHHYGKQGCKSQGNDKIKNEFEFYGSLISNQRSYWNFSSGQGSPASGFTKSILDYDSTLLNDPPPYFPSTGEYEFISWEEIKN